MKKVYIIDDDMDFLVITRHILSKDYQLMTNSALDLPEMTRFQPDLILMDNSVGNENAESLVNKMYAQIPAFSTPIILVSGHHNLADLAQKKEIFGYIQKPATINYIRSYIADFFALKKVS